jgi:hypothetical protein
VRITRKQLRQMINEELLREADQDETDPFDPFDAEKVIQSLGGKALLRHKGILRELAVIESKIDAILQALEVDPQPFPPPGWVPTGLTTP